MLIYCGYWNVWIDDVLESGTQACSEKNGRHECHLVSDKLVQMEIILVFSHMICYKKLSEFSSALYTSKRENVDIWMAQATQTRMEY